MSTKEDDEHAKEVELPDTWLGQRDAEANGRHDLDEKPPAYLEHLPSYRRARAVGGGGWLD